MGGRPYRGCVGPSLRAVRYTTQNSDLGVCNGILDGNKANQTSPASGEMACIYLNNVMRPRVYDLRVKNVRNYAGRFLAIDKGYFNDLHCQDSDGDGWSFGISSSSQHVLRSFIDNIYAEGCDGSYDGAGGLNGNGAVFTTQFCQVGKVITKDCGGGIKFQDESQDTDIAELKFIGKTNGSANSGVKIQGNGAGLTPTRINVGLISSYNAYGNGLFISDVNGVSIGRYVGSNNGSGAGASGSEKNDVQLSLSNGAGAHSVQIGAIFVDTPTAIGVQINGASPRVDIGSIVVRNATGSAVSDSTTTSRIYIGKIQAVDDAGTLTYAFVSTGTSKGKIDLIETSAAHSVTQSRVTLAAGQYDFEIGSIRLGSTDVLEGVARLGNGVTSTSVTCGHIWREFVGGSADYFHPIISIMAWDSTSAALGWMRSSVTDGSSATGFAIKHANSGAADDVYWKVLGWKVVSLVSS
jgi:hypothetical protein